MKKNSLLCLMLISLMVSCGPSHKVTASWVNPNFDRNKTYSKVFIFVMNQNQSATNIIETDLSNAAEAKGFTVMKSSLYFTPVFTRDQLPSKDAIMERVRQLGCDAILTVSLVDKQSETRYIPGNNVFMGGGMGMGMGRMGMGPGMGFGGFYGAMGPMMYNPGYYTEDKTYFYEADIFDVETETMIWSSQSEVLNPSSISKFSREYSKVVAERIRTDLMVKK
jgi:hypothetical protein